MRCVNRTNLIQDKLSAFLWKRQSREQLHQRNNGRDDPDRHGPQVLVEGFEFSNECDFRRSQPCRNGPLPVVVNACVANDSPKKGTGLRTLRVLYNTVNP